MRDLPVGAVVGPHDRVPALHAVAFWSPVIGTLSTAAPTNTAVFGPR